MLKQIALLFGLSGLLTMGAFAQSGNSTISGSVKDPADAVIAAAKVKITNVDTGTQINVETNESGLYRVGSLVPANYRIDVEAAGFSRVNRGPVTLQVGQTIAIDVVLQVGQQSEIVNVSEAAPLIESQSSDVAQTVNRQMLTALPLPNRAASSLAALAPGVVMVNTGAGTAENYPVFSIAGGRVRNQSYSLDGANVTNAAGLTRPMQLTSLPVDAMQEFKVVANSYPAEYGHSTGGVVIMSTRSGTNQFHGSVFESLQNNIFNARNYFAAVRPPLRLNQFGGSIGGPIQKDKTHFFLTWERTKQLVNDTQLSTVPTLLNREGNFSDLRTASGSPIVIYDPATTAGSTRQAFAGNIIPTSRFDPVAAAALKYYPLPNRNGTITNANNFTGNSANSLDRDIIVGRVDHRLNDNNLFTARYYINNSGTNNSGTYGIPISDPLSDITDVRVQSILGSYTHIFNSSLVNDVKFTYLRRKFIDTRPGYLDNLAAQIGLKGVTNAAFPAFTMPGYASLGNAAGSYRLQTPIEDKQFQDSLSWYHGKHALKFGGEVRLAGNGETRDRGSAGNFTISPLITGQVGVAGGGNALASLLLGEVNTASIQVSQRLQTRAQYLAGYLQDDYRITSNLTLNLGLRWETELPRYEVDNKMNSFDPYTINPISGTPGIVTFAGVNGTPRRAYAADKNNFGPRFGFAYRIPGKSSTVIRGGTGIFYASTVSNTIGDTAALGFSTQANYTVAQADVQSALRLRDGFPTVAAPALTPGLGAVPLGAKATTAISFFNPNQIAPISYQYNLSIQREISNGFLTEVGYIGNVSHHLAANDITLNQVPFNLLGPGDAQSRRPFPQYSNVTWINPTIGNSSYHGGFVRVERRFNKGFSVLAHYTFSKFLDDVSAAAGDELGDGGAYMDAYNRRLDKGRSGSDIPHRFLTTVSYEVRQFKGNRAVNAALGGWRIGFVNTIQSGAPFSVISNSNSSNAFSAGPIRPNLLRDATLDSDARSLGRWFDTSAFVAAPSFTFGNSPRGVLRGPGLWNTDVTFEKVFRLNERYRFELRGDLFNAFNHANFNIPGLTLGAANFGAITSARAPRIGQLSARFVF